ncbi:MAG TPA: hypothetical protein PK375_00395 [Rhodocyclaceae bacterium]|nr:hypothetical protein [Rhodocyclaceae bacterium]HNH34336.1 hypothetical protein [Rhodocyclaceae bacterium]
MNTVHRPRRPRLAIVDLIAFVVLALGIGLTAAIVLGGAVLLASGGESPVLEQAAVMRIDTRFVQ